MIRDEVKGSSGEGRGVAFLWTLRMYSQKERFEVYNYMVMHFQKVSVLAAMHRGQTQRA